MTPPLTHYKEPQRATTTKNASNAPHQDRHLPPHPQNPRRMDESARPPSPTTSEGYQASISSRGTPPPEGPNERRRELGQVRIEGLTETRDPGQQTPTVSVATLMRALNSVPGITVPEDLSEDQIARVAEFLSNIEEMELNHTLQTVLDHVSNGE